MDELVDTMEGRECPMYVWSCGFVGVGCVASGCDWRCCWVGEILKVGMVLARTWKRSWGELIVESVLCSRRQVRDGSVRPYWRLVMIALHVGVFCTIWLMCSGLLIVWGWTMMSRMMRILFLA